ncbi:MAG: hypothetical protein COB92_00695 [Robiginitomaculum sp.]|nr:MAG: hypothetical protein COB92_00695 [Robiginitomaculum sp.]
MDVNEQLQACNFALENNDLQSAEQQYHSLVETRRSLGDAHHLGAHIALKAGRTDIAKIRIGSALSTQDHHYEYLNTKGIICTKLQDEPEARKAYQASLLAKPDYLDAAQNLGKLLIDNSDPASAVFVYQSALKYHSDNEQLKVGLVIALKDSMRSEEALDALKNLGNANKHNHLKGQILFQLSRHEDAIQAYLDAMKMPKFAPPALKNLLQILWMRGEWDRADPIVQSVVKTADPAALIAAARSYILADKHVQAADLLEHGLQKFGRNAYILSERARLKLNAGEFESGYQDALEALSAKPGDLIIMEDFADCSLATGRLNDAMTAAHEALKIAPNNQYWIAVKYTAGRAMGQNHHYYVNYDSFVRPYELQPPEGYGSLEEYNHVLKQTLNEIHEFSAHPLDQSLRGGIQTVPDLRYVDHPVLKAHFKTLEAPIRAYMREIGNADPNHPLLRRNTGDYRLAGSWSVKLHKKGFHVPHVHPEGWISSAYYVDVPDEVADTEKKAGWIHFGKPPIPVIGQDGQELGYEKIVQPSPGTLVLFPSYMWHGTNPLEQDASRMTLPIDVVPI